MKSAILTYHSLDESGSPVSVSPETFEQHIRCLKSSGVPVVPLTRVLDVPGSVAITFDDGFRNFLDRGLPVLERYEVPATVFVVTGHCGGYNDWSQPMHGLPVLPLMNWNQLRSLPEGLVTLGGHTLTHPDLTRLPADEMEREVRESRALIESRIRRPVETFAYPYGRNNPLVRSVAGSAYSLVCGTELLTLSPDSDRTALPRIDAYYLQKMQRFEAFVSGNAERYLTLRRTMRALRSLLVH